MQHNSRYNAGTGAPLALSVKLALVPLLLFLALPFEDPPAVHACASSLDDSPPSCTTAFDFPFPLLLDSFTAGTTVLASLTAGRTEVELQRL